MKFIFILTVISLVSLFPLCLSAQAAACLIAQADSISFVNYKLHGTRTVGLAESNLADSYDISGMDLNAAVLVFHQKKADIIFTSFHNWNTNLAVQQLSMPVFNNTNHAVAASILLHHDGVESFNYLGSAPYPKPEFNFYQVSVGYAAKLSSSLGVGTTTYLSLSSQEDRQYWNYSIDMGVVYKPTNIVGYGIAFRGLGTGARYQITPTGETILNSRMLPQSLEIGGTINFPDQSDRKTFSVSLSNEKVFGREGLWYRGGIEILPVHFLALRGGYIYNPDQRGPRFGLGLNSAYVRVDYGISYNKALADRLHQLSVSVNF